MPIDIGVQFNGHNSYRVTETVFCDPFGVEAMSYVTHSFKVYAGTALGTAVRARTRFFAADGSITGTTDHSFAVPVIFTEVDITLAVPALSVLGQLYFLTSDIWWVTEPKSEEGQTAMPYNTNYQGQLSMITPDGAYLGFLTTAQIVVAGTLASPSESLAARLITINNNAIILSVTSAEHGLRLTQINAGIIYVCGSSTFAAGYDPATKETPAGAQARVNALAASLGYLAGQNVVEIARLGTTIVNGGYLQTILIDATLITTGYLAAGRLQAGTITADKIAAGTITADKIAAGTITADKIAAGTITADKIAAGTITGDKLNVNSVVAMKLTADAALSAYVVAVPYAGWAMLSAFDTDYSAVNEVWSIYGSGIQSFLNMTLKGSSVFHTGIGSFNTGSVMDPNRNNENFSVFAQTDSNGGRDWGMGWGGAGFVNGYFSVNSGGFTFYFGTNSFGLDNTGLWKRINNGYVEYL